MEWNKFIFPAPKKGYSLRSEHLIIIPRYDLDELPSRLLSSTKLSERNKTIIIQKTHSFDSKRQEKQIVIQMIKNRNFLLI